MTTPDRDEPVLDIARGDAALSRQLRRALTMLRERTDDEEFRQVVDDVLAGRTGVRDAAESAAFGRVLDPMVTRFAEQYDALSEQERQRLAAQGEQDLEAERERLRDDRPE